MSFDPYHKWLGIPPEDQPPNHYRLLGINLYESDDDVISNAADQRMTHVRSFQTGRHADSSQRLLNEIATARVSLLDPEEKSAYDAALRTHLAPASTPARVIPTAVPLASPIAPPSSRSTAPPALPSTQRAAEKSTPNTSPDAAVGDRPVNVVATRPRPHLKYLPIAIVAVVGAMALIVAFAFLSAHGFWGRPEIAKKPDDRPSPAGTRGGFSGVENGDERVRETSTGEDSDNPPAETALTDGQPKPPPTDESPTPKTGSTPENGTSTARQNGDPQTRPDSSDGDHESVPGEPTAATDTTLTRLPQPDNDSVLSAQQRLESTVASESPKQLLERARSQTDNATDTFVILIMAKERAVAAGDVRMAVAAIDELDRRFEIDAFDAKMELLTQLTADDNEIIDHRWLAELALSQVGDALERDRHDLAKDCASVALGAARKSGDSQLVREATLAIVKLQKP